MTIEEYWWVPLAISLIPVATLLIYEVITPKNRKS